MSINYERMNAVHPKQKAALTRATHKPESQRYAAVLAACKAAVKEWELIGAWPDDWSRWQRALDDAARFDLAGAAWAGPRLESLT